MGNADCTLDRATKPSPPVHRGAVKRLLAVALAIGAAIALVYGETWAIERAPLSTVACAFAQTADLKRALDGAPASRTGAL
jgi:hypothetical protein